jgi:lysylphosphatidylglycerol synthase-like protein
VKWLHRMLILLGGGGFVLLLARSDLASLWRDAAALGAGAALIVAVALLEHVLHALAWRRCFAPEQRPGAFSLLGAYLAGGAVNLVTPTATLGGEVVRGGLLPRGIPASVWVATGTADRLAMAAADTAIGLAGFAVLVTRGPQGGFARAALGSAALLLAAGVAGFLVLQRRGRLAAFFGEHGLVRRLAGAQLGERLASASREVDGRLAALHAERPGDFRAAFALHLAGACVGALQLAIFLSWLGVPYDLATLGSVFAVGMALDLFSFFVPARLGAQEAARMLAMSVGGIDASRGLLFSLVLRLEQILWAGAGFLAVPFLLRARRGSPPLASGAPAVGPSRAGGAAAELPMDGGRAC